MNLIRNQDDHCPICMASAERHGVGGTYGLTGYGMSSGGMLDPGVEDAWGRLGIVPHGDEFQAGGLVPAGGERFAPCCIPPIGQSPELTACVSDCFGTASVQYLDGIRRLIDEELVLRQEFLSLAERGNQTAAPLRNIAAESLESARKLAAAHYLISGQFYWPERIHLPAQSQDFAFELRRQFNLAKDMESNYRLNADEVWDRCLGNLYLVLADTKVGQIGRLFAVLGSF